MSSISKAARRIERINWIKRVVGISHAEPIGDDISRLKRKTGVIENKSADCPDMGMIVAAYDALELIDVDYQTLPSVTDPEQAARSGAPQLHAEVPGNQAFDNVRFTDVRSDSVKDGEM